MIVGGGGEGGRLSSNKMNRLGKKPPMAHLRALQQPPSWLSQKAPISTRDGEGDSHSTASISWLAHIYYYIVAFGCTDKLVNASVPFHFAENQELREKLPVR